MGCFFRKGLTFFTGTGNIDEHFNHMVKKTEASPSAAV